MTEQAERRPRRAWHRRPAARADAACRPGRDLRARLRRYQDRRHRRADRDQSCPGHLLLQDQGPAADRGDQALRGHLVRRGQAPDGRAADRRPAARGVRGDEPAARPRSRARRATGSCGWTSGRRPRRNADVASVRQEFDERWREVIVSLVRAGQEAGEFADIDPHPFSIFVSALLDGLTIQIALDDPVVDPISAYELCMRYIADRLGFQWTPSGRERVNAAAVRAGAGR